MGIYACDPEGYTTFAPVLDAVIKDYHKVKGEITHPTPTFGKELIETDSTFEDLDPSGKFIISTRVRVGRSHAGYGFPPVLNMEASVYIYVYSSLLCNVS